MSDKPLTMDLKQQISCLEDSLGKIAFTRRAVGENAKQASYNIRCAISRHLESVRRRETWLLEQVDVLEGAKEVRLAQQAQDLTARCATLQAYLACLDGNRMRNVTQKIEKAVQNLPPLELDPVETSHLSFQADVATLRDAIRQFGLVDSVEDACQVIFEGEEHHLCDEPCVEQTSPPPASQWLFRQETNDEMPSVQQLTFPPFQEGLDLDQWLSADQAPLHQYLQSDMEEDVDPSIEVLSLPRSSWSDITPFLPSHVSNLFLEVAASPRESWLKDEQDASLTTSYEAVEGFTTASDNMDNWLLKDSDEKNCGDACKCAVTTSYEIEELDRMQCTTTSPVSKYISEMTSDPHSWLKQDTTTDDRMMMVDDDDEKDVDDHEISVAQGITHLCKANETCKTFADCLCDENCCSSTKMSDAARSWLLAPKTPEVISEIKEAPILEYFSMVTKANQSDWLSVVEKVESSNIVFGEGSRFPPFEEDQSAQQWLSASSDSQIVSLNAQCPFRQHFNHVQSADTSEWVKSDSSEVAMETTSFKSPLSKPASNDFSSWLKNVDTNDAKVVNVIENNPWLLSQAPSVPKMETESETNWLVEYTPAQNAEESCKTDDLFKKLNSVEPVYSWSLATKVTTEVEVTEKVNDKPVPKSSELPECENIVEEGKWLLVDNSEASYKEKSLNKVLENNVKSKGEEEVDNVIAMKSKLALGEWLLNTQSNFY